MTYKYTEAEFQIKIQPNGQFIALGFIATIPIYAKKYTKAEFDTKKFGQPQYFGKKLFLKQSHLVVNFNEVKYVRF